MPRSRSRSPQRRDRERRRSRSRERRSKSRERRHRHRRSRSPGPPRARRSRSPHSPKRRSRSGSSNRDRSESRESEGPVIADKQSSSHLVNKEKVDKEGLKSRPKDEQDMMKLMGFSSFETTKDKKVAGNNIYVTNLMRKRRYRQYMNRRGGFNRPLDFIA